MNMLFARVGTPRIKVEPVTAYDDRQSAQTPPFRWYETAYSACLVILTVHTVLSD